MEEAGVSQVGDTNHRFSWTGARKSGGPERELGRPASKGCAGAASRRQPGSSKGPLAVPGQQPRGWTVPGKMPDPLLPASSPGAGPGWAYICLPGRGPRWLPLHRSLQATCLLFPRAGAWGVGLSSPQASRDPGRPASQSPRYRRGGGTWAAAEERRAPRAQVGRGRTKGSACLERGYPHRVRGSLTRSPQRG